MRPTFPEDFVLSLTAVGKVLFSFGSFASLLFLIGWSARVTGIFDGALFG